MTLLTLKPHWVAMGARSCVGFSFGCPAPGHEDRLTLFFKNPMDGAEPVELPKVMGENQQLFTVEKCGDGSAYLFAHLTLTEEIDVEGHWRGWIRNGMLVENDDPR